MFSLNSSSHHIGEQDDDGEEEIEEKKHPPTTFNEWFELNNFEEWPQRVEEEDDETELHGTPAFLGMSTMDEILQQVKSRARILSYACFSY